MKAKKFSEALGNIKESYIEEAAIYTAKSPFRAKWIAAAACFALILTAMISFLPMIHSGKDNKKYYDYSINGGTFSSYIGASIIAEEKIGSKLEDVTVTAGWKNENGEWVTEESLRAEVYAIEGVGSTAAAALKLIDPGESLSASHYYVILHPNAEYNGMLFPDYKTENPVRYLEESDMGKCNGWQDFGTEGEIRTITVPIGSTYIYQMYSYYIRNDLSHIYAKETLPSRLTELPEWLSDTAAAGRRSFWYSMGIRIPEAVTLTTMQTIKSENGDASFIKAEYQLTVKNGEGQKEENWVVYFMEENGVYSAFAVHANENFDFVKSYSESIVRSFRKKQVNE